MLAENWHADEYTRTEDTDISLHSHSWKYTLDKGQPLRQRVPGKLDFPHGEEWN